jgi:hypothetical protein
MAVLGIAACGVSDPADPPSIAGRYDLVAVNGTALPCCAQTDSTGTRITFVGGSLTLGDASPESFAATPAGWMPASCVHEVPDGAHVDTSGVVTLPDGKQYRIPTCTELHHVPYTLVVTQRYDYASDSSKTVSATSSGTYAWSDDAGNHAGMVALLNANLIGPVTLSTGAVDAVVGRSNFGRGSALTPADPEYQFRRTAP